MLETEVFGKWHRCLIDDNPSVLSSMWGMFTEFDLVQNYNVSPVSHVGMFALSPRAISSFRLSSWELTVIFDPHGMVPLAVSSGLLKEVTGLAVAAVEKRMLRRSGLAVGI